MRTRVPALGLVLAPLLGASPQESPAVSFEGRGLLAVRAGTIHVVEDGTVLENGAILIRAGKILAVGNELEIPDDAEVVDYGPDAVIVPGLVAPWSAYAMGAPSERTVDLGLLAVDGVDFMRVHADGLAGGVTSAYVTPAESRLIAGVGALVKLAGDDPAERVLNRAAAIHGAIDASARNAPGYWKPPVPVSVDVELGFQKPQLPKTTMGAVLALRELLDGARGAAEADRPAAEAEYGARAPAELARLLEAKVPLRISAVEAGEIRALLDLARERELRLVLDRADEANLVAREIAEAEVGVVYRIPYFPNSAAFDRGKGEDDRWPSFAVPAELARAGARVAITAVSPRDLLFAARLASRGGLDPALALRAITLTPAELFGAAERVGSLRAGKDADLCVLNGPPLESASSVLATWIDGKVVWNVQASGRAARERDRERSARADAASERGATVVQVAELHVGDGRVLRPGELLMRSGELVEVGERVSHPRGATIVRGQACMPGMIDALGHLGLEGSKKVPATDYALSSIVAPGDRTDRKVALNGITTVVLSPREPADSGAPVMAYKPAERDFERQVLGDPVALYFRWAEANPLKSGETLKNLLQKAKEYREKWLEYERAIAAWTPPKSPPVAEKDEKVEGEEGKKEEGEQKEEDEKDKQETEKKDDDKAKSESKSKKKKDEPKELDPDPITGLWQASFTAPGGSAASPLKLRLKLETPGKSGPVEGSLRNDAVSADLVMVEGWFDREAKKLALNALGSRGWVVVAAELKDAKLEGTVSIAGQEAPLSAERVSTEYVVIKRPERRQEKEEQVPEPKGKPKEPKRDPKLEPLRRAMEGKASVVVAVDGAPEILACIEAFEKAGIRPVLYGARGAHEIATKIAGKVAGILLPPTVVDAFSDQERGTDYRTPYADLQNAGIKVAFLSEAEEGAIDLPVRASFAIANGMSPAGALRALTADAASMMSIDERVGRLEAGLDADVLLLDGPPLDPATSILRVWVGGEEVIAP